MPRLFIFIMTLSKRFNDFGTNTILKWQSTVDVVHYVPKISVTSKPIRINIYVFVFILRHHLYHVFYKKVFEVCLHKFSSEFFLQPDHGVFVPAVFPQFYFRIVYINSEVYKFGPWRYIFFTTLVFVSNYATVQQSTTIIKWW
jgi:hypothetical protein